MVRIWCVRHQVNSAHRFLLDFLLPHGVPRAVENMLFMVVVCAGYGNVCVCVCLPLIRHRENRKQVVERGCCVSPEGNLFQTRPIRTVCVCGCVAPIDSGDKYILFDDNNDDFRQPLWLSHNDRKFIFNRKIGSWRIMHTVHAHPLEQKLLKFESC